MVSDDGQLVAYVVLQPPRPGDAADSAEQLARWHSLFESLYDGSDAQARPGLDFSGWESAYTRRAIPAGEMEAWADHTAARIAALGGKRILEIGCGTGLLLLRLARGCER